MKWTPIPPSGETPVNDIPQFKTPTINGRKSFISTETNQSYQSLHTQIGVAKIWLAKQQEIPSTVKIWLIKGNISDRINKTDTENGQEKLAEQWRVAMRKVSYLPLWHLLLERGMTKSQMRIEAGLTTNVLANMNKGQHISMDSLIRICDALDCNLNDVVELVKTEE